jgi:hypothetical protein
LPTLLWAEDFNISYYLLINSLDYLGLHKRIKNKVWPKQFSIQVFSYCQRNMHLTPHESFQINFVTYQKHTKLEWRVKIGNSSVDPKKHWANCRYLLPFILRELQWQKDPKNIPLSPEQRKKIKEQTLAGTATLRHAVKMDHNMPLYPPFSICQSHWLFSMKKASDSCRGCRTQPMN